LQLLNASGCLDALTAPDVARELDAYVTKTVTPEPREGNAPPRIAETEHGMLNAIGLANPGRDAFIVETLPRLRELGVPLGCRSAVSPRVSTPRRARNSTT
jgi:Dihydroorotate dehydrogenase